MSQITISGESIEELDTTTTQLLRAEKLAESGLLNVFEDVLEVKNALKEQAGESGSVRRNEIEKNVDANVYQSLQLLQAYGIAKSSGQGGNWEYKGN